MTLDELLAEYAGPAKRFPTEDEAMRFVREGNFDQVAAALNYSCARYPALNHRFTAMRQERLAALPK